MKRINVKIFLEGGSHYTLEMDSDSALLKSLFESLVSRTHPLKKGSHEWFQIPLDQGKSLLSFRSDELMAILTQPPVAVAKVDEFILNNTCFFHPQDV